MSDDRLEQSAAAPIRIERISDDDAALTAFVNLLVDLDPNARGLTLHALRCWDQLTNQHLRVIASIEGRAIGVAGISATPNDPRSRTLPCQLQVHPDAYDRGVGQALLLPLLNWARTHRTDPILSVGVAPQDAPALAFWTARGMRQRNRFDTLTCDFHDDIAAAASPPPEHVTIVSMAARADLLHAMWELMRDTWNDAPGKPAVMPTFEQWATSVTSGQHPAGACLLALDARGTPCGLTTTVMRATGSHAYIAVTAVRPDMRRQGIATCLKHRQLAWCKQHGITSLSTVIHHDNHAIRDLNLAMGFRPTQSLIILNASVQRLELR